MGPVGKVERVIATIAWTIVAAFLFGGFGMVFGSAVSRTVGALGPRDEVTLEVVENVSRVFMGAVILLISRAYRKTAGADNAGSVAAWLAGWTVVLFSVAGLLAQVDDWAAPAILVAVLLVWTTVRLARHFASPGKGTADEEAPNEREDPE